MRRHDFAILGLLFFLPLVMFWQQTVDDKTLLPTENLYQFEPYATYREVVKAPAQPYNELLSDLVLQNYQWKSFIRTQLAQGEIPLWNPHNFGGTPFMAAGQQSTLYPLSILYYIMPLTAAYGWFTVVNLWLAGVFMYLFARSLNRSRFGATLAAITYQLCGMFIASAVHPMIIGGVVWMPLLLMMAEYILCQRALFGRPASAPWVAIGAVALACNITAGHVEITIYTLLILGYYSGLRLLIEFWQKRREAHALHALLQRFGWLTAMVVLGVGLGAIQLVPLYEFVRTNWRASRSDLQTVLDYAHPYRDILQFLMPNFYGNPTHHSYFDVFSGQNIAIAFTNVKGVFKIDTDWGMKNYVEGALYLGILPLCLAGFAVVGGLRNKRNESVGTQYIAPLHNPPSRTHILIFALLIVISLTFMFGLPTYALIYVLPGINQLNTAFRWIYGVTIGVAVLAAFGADALSQYPKAAKRVGIGLVVVGGLVLVGLLASRLLYPQFEPLIQRVIDSLERANEAFTSAAMFYSYQLPNVAIFGVMLIGSGIVFYFGAKSVTNRQNAKNTQETQSDIEKSGENSDNDSLFSSSLVTYHLSLKPIYLFAVALVALDLLIASWGFNPASDPALLDFTPPAIEWLKAQPGEWRYTVVNDGIHPDILRANMTLRDGLDDITGYDSIISKQYVDYMRIALPPQTQLDFNRIAPLYVWDDYEAIITSPQFAMLNVKYIVTHKTTTFSERLTISDTRFPPSVKLAYEDEAVKIWEVPHAPRAYTLSGGDPNGLEIDTPINAEEWTTEIVSDTGRELILNVNNSQETWLVVSQSYAPGWKAFIRPQGAGEDAESESQVELVRGNFQGVYLPEAGNWTIRLIYSPTSFQVGVFGSILTLAVLILTAGTWVWRMFIAPQSAENSSAASRLARNSLAPILLNLFNRSIDLVFAAVMFRILGPLQAGFYYYAIAIFGWFDILTNFGLDVYLMREAGRNRERAGFYFSNTSFLRFGLIAACIPVLMAFIFIRQATGDPLNQSVLLAIALFYVGLIPGSISKGLTSLFYAFERAEYPAAVTTITTIFKVAFGLIALLLGYGITGLASVSIITNLITLAVLFTAAQTALRRIREAQTQPVTANAVDTKLIRGMMGQSFPLMLNHLLATIFFQIDIVIMEWIWGGRMVGLYRTAYSWLLAINVIPAFFTQALMPIMSRQWQNDKPALKRTYTLGIKLLVSIAFPMAVVFTVLAELLTQILGGSAYLPDGAVALQIMIWSIPIGWMNSLTQYALVAVDLQRRITRAFIIAVVFNIGTNVILIPQYGYQAAAVITILSEGVLFISFARLMQSVLGRFDWLGILWKPAAASGAMFVVIVGVGTLQPFIGFIAGVISYPVILLLLRPLDANEIAFIAGYLPARVKRVIQP